MKTQAEKNKSFEAEKLELIQLLAASTDPGIIKRIRGVLFEEETDWWDELTEEQQKELEEAIAQADRGELIAHEDVMKKYRKWLSK